MALKGFAGKTGQRFGSCGNVTVQNEASGNGIFQRFIVSCLTVTERSPYLVPKNGWPMEPEVPECMTAQSVISLTLTNNRGAVPLPAEGSSS